VELAWQFIDPIQKAWEELEFTGLSHYEPGTWGPLESDELLAHEGRCWVVGSQLC
jgi:glucose-6-phosphate 1-dehydrogenase